MNSTSCDPTTDLKAGREFYGIPQLDENEFHFAVLDAGIVIKDNYTKNKASSGRAHGTNSVNWKQQDPDEHDMTLDAIVEILDNGGSIVGGHYVPTEKDPSRRKDINCVEIQLMMFDFDTWTKEQEVTADNKQIMEQYDVEGFGQNRDKFDSLIAPETTLDFLNKYNDVREHIAIVKESVNSKDGARKWGGVAKLERPIVKDPNRPQLLVKTFEILNGLMCAKFPFAAQDQYKPTRIRHGVADPAKKAWINEHAVIPSFLIDEAERLAKQEVKQSSSSFSVSSSTDSTVLEHKNESDNTDFDTDFVPQLIRRMMSLKTLIKDNAIAKNLRHKTPIEAFKTEPFKVLNMLAEAGWIENYKQTGNNKFEFKWKGSENPMSAKYNAITDNVTVYGGTMSADLRRKKLVSKSEKGQGFKFSAVASLFLYGQSINQAERTAQSRKSFERKLHKDGFGKVKKTSDWITKRNKVIDKHLNDPDWCEKHNLDYDHKRMTNDEAFKFFRKAVDNNNFEHFSLIDSYRRTKVKLGPELFQDFDFDDLDNIRNIMTSRMLGFLNESQIGTVNLIDAETGLGKTHSKEDMISKADFGVLQIALTKVLADEYESRMNKRHPNTKSYMWKARSFNYDTEVLNNKKFRNMNDTERISYFEHQQENVDPQVMCIQSEKHDKLISKGVQSAIVLCDNCPVKDLCETSGYLSQKRSANRSQNLIYCGSTSVSKSTPHQFFQEILNTYGNKSREMLILDDFHLDNYIEDVTIGAGDLKQWSERFPKSELDKLATKLYDILVDKDLNKQQVFEQFREHIKQLSDKQLDEVSYLLAHVPINGVMEKVCVKDYNGQELSLYRFVADFKGQQDEKQVENVALYIPTDTKQETVNKLSDVLLNNEIHDKLDPNSTYTHHDILRSSAAIDKLGRQVLPITIEQAIRFGFANIDSDQQMELLPKVFDQKWNPIRKLKAFFEQSTIENAYFEVTNGGSIVAFDFVVPTPFRDLSNMRTVILSGTANPQHLKQVFDLDVQHRSLPKAQWKNTNKCFQHRCGVFPRKSLLNREQNENGTYIYTGLSDDGRRIMDQIEKVFEHDRDTKFALITTKAIKELEQDRLFEQHDNLCSVHNYGATEGLDDISEQADVVILLGSPERRPSDIERYAKILYASDPVPLNFDIVEAEDELSADRFVDSRVQSAFESMVRDDLLQAAGRARLNSKDNKTLVILTANYLPGYSERATLIDHVDLAVLNTFDKKDHFWNLRSQLDAQNTN